MTLPRTARILVRVLMGLWAAILLLSPSQVLAHGDDPVSPPDGEVLNSAPSEIRVFVAGTDPVDLGLYRVDGGIIPWTDQVQRADGIVRAQPPALEPGTYIVRWVSGSQELSSSFSIGRQDAVHTPATLPGRPPVVLAVVLLLTVLLLVGALRGIRVLLLVPAGLVAALLLSTVRSPVDGLYAVLVCLALLAAPTVVRLAQTVPVDRNTPVRVAAAALLSLTTALLPVVVLARHRFSLASGPVLFGSVAPIALVVVIVLPLLLRKMTGGSSGRKTSPMLLGVLMLAALVPAEIALAQGVPERIEKVAVSNESPLECLTGKNRLVTQRCLEASYSETVATKGVVEALESVRELLASAPQSRFFCHEVSHAIGRASMRLYGDLAEAFRNGYDVCDFGYYHGIVEGAAGTMTDDEFRQAVPRLCADFASTEELFYMQCNHGLGHAAARRTNNDMLRSLEFCDALADAPQLTGERLAGARNGCGTGVSMEWFATVSAGDATAASPQVAQPREVCELVPDSWSNECFEYVGNTVDSSNPVGSLLEIGNWCASTGHEDACFKGVARAAGGLGLGTEDVLRICDSNASTRETCLSFYILVVATTIDFDLRAVDRICADLPLSDREGAFSVCERTRGVAAGVLSSTGN